MLIEYHALQVILPAGVSESTHWKFHYQIEKGELYVSPHTALCSIGKEAHLDSVELAQDYAKRLTPIFEKRYGKGVEILLTKVTTNQSKHTERRINEHSKLVRARLDQNLMAPNKRPAMEE